MLRKFQPDLISQNLEIVGDVAISIGIREDAAWIRRNRIPTRSAAGYAGG
jgi:hypothetical protein